MWEKNIHAYQVLYAGFSCQIRCQLQESNRPIFSSAGAAGILTSTILRGHLAPIVSSYFKVWKVETEHVPAIFLFDLF